jgi:hypothetical protein
MAHELSGIASEGHLWAYASGMITFLRASLASERRAHAQTRCAARARIAVLEAQVSRRDTELAERIRHTGQTLPRASPSSTRISPSRIPDLPPSPPPIHASQIDAALHRTLAQNAMFEQEVEKLAARVSAAFCGLLIYAHSSVS